MRSSIGAGLLGLCSLAGAACSGEVEAPASGAAGSGGSAAGEPGNLESDPLAAPEDVAAPPAGAEVTASGLASRVLTPGTGARHPTETDTVRVHYTGWQTNGVRFDTSRNRGPAEFPLDRVIAGWTEGLQLMVEGEERRLWIPERLAYRGEEPSGTLVFDVELIAIVTP